MNIDVEELAKYLAYTETQIYFDFKVDRIYEPKKDETSLDEKPNFRPEAQKIYDTCLKHYSEIIETFQIKSTIITNL